MNISTSNQVCSYCRESASIFCTCQSKKTFLCVQCIGKHYTQFPMIGHPLLPLQAEGVRTEEYQARLASFNARKTKLLEELSRMEQCCTEYSAEMNAFLERAVARRDSVLQTLQAQQAAISSELTSDSLSVERTLDQSNPQSCGRFFNYLRGLGPDYVPLFSYQLETANLYKELDTMLKIDICENIKVEEIGEPILPCIGQRQMTMFDFERRAWGPMKTLSSPVTSDPGSSYVMLTASTLFLCGGTFYTASYQARECNHAYTVSLSGSVSQLPDMQYSRNYPGVVAVPRLNSVFVFGGTNNDTAEKVTFSDFALVWEMTAQMSAIRFAFNPVLWQDAVILIGGNSNSMEIFDLLTSVMHPVALILPESSYTVTVVDIDEMIVMQDNYVTRIHARNGTFVVVANTHKQKNTVWANCGPVVVAGTAFFTYEFVGVGVEEHTGEVTLRAASQIR